MDSGNFNVSISIKIKTNNDNQFLISKYGFFKFFLVFLGILKLTYLQNADHWLWLNFSIARKIAVWCRLETYTYLNLRLIELLSKILHGF